MKERYLDILVPIKDGDAEATVYASLAALETAVPASASNVNKIYEIADGTYYRSTPNGQGSFSYVAVTDREFPYLGDPMRIYDFTYDATRMGNAPTISAQAVMRFADKDASGYDVTLEGVWSLECYVVFNGEKFHLRRMPNTSKSNEDARYKYDMEFVSDRVVLENTYFYDVVSPFVTEKPVSESATFSFFGDITELAKRLNASLIRTGMSQLTRKYVGYPNHPSVTVQYLSYEQWNQVGINPYALAPSVFVNVGQAVEFRATIYDALSGDYNRYLMEYVFVNDQGDFETTGYKVVIGKDKKGDTSSSEEKLLTFDKNTVYEALQAFHDEFELDYYVTMERDQYGAFTGNTLLMVADCEHDFADWDEDEEDYVRGDDGVPISTSPFDYGATEELLAKEKNAKNEKLVTRITGVGSSDNLPWHYPNPTPDGWIKPVYKIGGVEDTSITIDYPKTDASLDYEKYLKNRIGNAIRYGKEKDFRTCTDYRVVSSTVGGFFVDYQLSSNDITNPRLAFRMTLPNRSNCTGFVAELKSATYQTLYYYDSRQTYQSPNDFQLMCQAHDGKRCVALEDSSVYIFRITFLVSSMPSSTEFDYSGYLYPWTMVDIEDTPLHQYGPLVAYIGQNFYDQQDLTEFADFRINSLQEAYIYDCGYSISGDTNGKVEPMLRVRNKQYKDLATGTIYKCTDQNATDWYSGDHKTAFTENPTMSREEWIATFLYDFRLRVYESDKWYIGEEEILLEDYGLGTPEQGGVAYVSDIFDTIEFQRVSWLTPQPNLMPEVYIRTDGERRFYVAHNYYPLQQGTPDTAIGEENNEGTPDIVNPIYKENETDTDDKHYEFENEYSQLTRVEHIEDFDDVKPTIKEQTIIINGVEYRIDVAEEFGYDMLDNDEIWENNDNDGTQAGEFKHPYFFVKLRPLGFNIFDLALQDDMVLSMTTGDCGACNFRIGVDEKTRKNPVQVWEYDVYDGQTLSSSSKVYGAGDLRRYVSLDNLYCDINGTVAGMRPARDVLGVGGGVVNNEQEWAEIMFENYTYSEAQVEAGEVGVTKQNGKYHFEGDVVTQGRFMDGQQDTTSGYVWVALMKDTDTYGTVMPAAHVDYEDHAFDYYIRPKSVADVHVNADPEQGIEESTNAEDEERADKFVLINIAMPQVYLRRAERLLSRKLVEYMYEHNAQKYNFSIKFSRIYLDENQDVNDDINENSVVYVMFDRKSYRQYVRHYTYRMSSDAPLPEITVETNEELPVTMTMLQRQEKSTKRASMAVSRNFNVVNQKIREVSKSSNTYVSGGGSTVIENKLEWGEF